MSAMTAVMAATPCHLGSPSRAKRALVTATYYRQVGASTLIGCLRGARTESLARASRRFRIREQGDVGGVQCGDHPEPGSTRSSGVPGQSRVHQRALLWAKMRLATRYRATSSP